MIGVVTTSYPRSRDDGAGGFVRERVRALRRAGHAVEIIAAGDACASEPAPESAGDEAMVTRIGGRGLFYAGGAPEALEDARRTRRLVAWGKAIGFSSALFAELTRRRGRWHAVESHWLVPCGLLTSMALPGLAHRSHVHGGDLFVLRRLPWADSLARAYCRTRPELVFASARLRDELSDLMASAPESFGAVCRVEAAPFDRSRFHARSAEERARLRVLHGFVGPTLLAAGRLVPIKGFDRLIAALAALPPTLRPDLVIAGDGPERRSLERAAVAAGVQVRFLGNLGQMALAETMVAADLFVHPCRSLPDGRSEGMPLAVREALACGLPVLASASGGLVELEGTPGLRLVQNDDDDDDEDEDEHVGELSDAIGRALAERRFAGPDQG